MKSGTTEGAAEALPLPAVARFKCGAAPETVIGGALLSRQDLVHLHFLTLSVRGKRTTDAAFIPF